VTTAERRCGPGLTPKAVISAAAEERRSGPKTLRAVFTTRRFNTIPVRVIVDANGHVKHAHLLSAFPEQYDAILAALRNWTFKPYRTRGKAVEVETGIVFGRPLPRSTAAPAQQSPPARSQLSPSSRP
jgi:hypothetical protein